jgi:hypothetical protein
MWRAASVCLLVTVAGCGEPSSPASPSPSSTTTTPAPAGAVLTKIEVDPSVLGGQSARARVTLSSPAPPAGVAISLSTSGTAATVPASLTVPAGATTAAFAVDTTRVTATTDVTITAQAAAVIKTAVVRLRIDPAGLTPAANYTIGFSGLRDNRAAVPAYTESGFIISPVSAEWVGVTTYGNPLPSLQFFAPAGATVTGEIRITAGGSPFWLRSVDFYSSVTRIPYVIEGSLSSEPAFTQLQVLGNTFGNFVRVLNSRADVPVDVVLIRLSNPLPGATGGSNPMGIDNIVLDR